MSENLTPGTEPLADREPGPMPPPPAPSPGARTLHRSLTDRHIAGVCGGIAEHLGIDPLLVRVITVVLAFAGGAGIVLYVAGWLLIPEAGATQSELERALDNRDRGRDRSWLWIVFAVVVALAVAGVAHNAGGLLVAVAVIVGVVLLAKRDKRGAAPLPAPDAAAAGEPGPPAGFPRPARSRSGRVALSMVLLVSGLLLAYGLVTDTTFSAATVLAVDLVLVGLMLVVGSFFAPVRRVIWIGLVVTLLLSATAGVHGSIGDQIWRPTTANELAATYELGVGQGTLDLTQLGAAVPTGKPIRVNVGVGKITVLIPADWQVQLRANIGLGTLRIDGVQIASGSVHRDISVPPTAPPGLLTKGTVGSPVVVLDLSNGLGDIEVNHEAV